MDSRRDSTDGPEDVDAAFAEIVAGLERDGVGSGWSDEADEVAVVAMRPEGRPLSMAPKTDQDPESAADDDPDDHFVPPEPPPLPALRLGTIAALVVILLGVVLLAAPRLFGLTSKIGTPLALVAMCAGVGWLVLRLRHTPPPDSGWDDGAVL